MYAIATLVGSTERRSWRGSGSAGPRRRGACLEPPRMEAMRQQMRSLVEGGLWDSAEVLVSEVDGACMTLRESCWRR